MEIAWHPYLIDSGWLDQQRDGEVFKGEKKNSIFLLDFETLSLNSDHVPGERKWLIILVTQSLWYWLLNL